MSTLGFLDRIAEEKIREALQRGDLDHLPGAGKPLPDEDDMAFVPPELRMAYRVLKNAGFVPEELRLRREIADAAQLLEFCDEDSADYREGMEKLHFLMARLGDLRGGNLALQDAYFRQLTAKLARRNRTAIDR